MRKFIFMAIAAILMALPTFAQDVNSNPDSIIGEYSTERGGKASKIRVTKNQNGTYTAQVFWVQNPLDANGKKRKDVKNPDKSLRNVDIDQVVLVDGLKYNSADKSWGGTKIYDPSKGIKVNVEAKFETPDKLRLEGTIFGIGVTLYWIRIK